MPILAAVAAATASPAALSPVVPLSQKKCIDCACYAPAFYDLQCDWGFSLDLEFLYWYARETNLSYALEVRRVSKFNAIEVLNVDYIAPSKYKHLGTSWDPGFRVGIGGNSSCDGWDWNLNWTYMKK